MAIAPLVSYWDEFLLLKVQTTPHTSSLIKRSHSGPGHTVILASEIAEKGKLSIKESPEPTNATQKTKKSPWMSLSCSVSGN